MMKLVFTILFFVVVARSASVPQDPVAELEKALTDVKDASQFLSYIKASSQVVRELVTGMRSTGNPSFTVFAPTNAAYQKRRPQGESDPFLVDVELRNSMLLRHTAVVDSQSLENLEKVPTFQMGDGSFTKVTRKGGIRKIFNATISPEPFKLGGDLGVVFLVDQVFGPSGNIAK